VVFLTDSCFSQAEAFTLFKETIVGHKMSEVARRAGVSKATVSRVLNKTHTIAPATEQRVLEVVRQLNYHKNVHAQRLATGRSALLGLVISEITNPYFPEIIRGFQAEAWEREFDVILCNTEYSSQRSQSVIQKLIESDGEEFSEEIAEALADTKRRKERFVQGMNATLREVLSSVEKVPADIFFDDYFRLTAPRIAEVFAERTGVLEACRDRGIEGLLEIRSVRTAIVIALSCRYGQTFEGSPLSLADSIDYLHAPAAAATAEVFVCDDSHLRDALARVGLDNFRVMSMAEFLTASGTSDAAD